MISTLIIVVFVLGYLAIALEHPIKIDKAASALFTGVACWALYVFTGASHEDIEHGLLHHVYEIASILFFLMGAMTVVELVDAHEGFAVITDKITTTNKVKLLWIVVFITFFFSAVLDNLTTAIVMVSLLRKLVHDKPTRWLYVGVVVIAANAGGAWSPIGDVTTTMLWTGQQLPDVAAFMMNLILPSLICVVVPTIVLSFTMKGNLEKSVITIDKTSSNFERNLIFYIGVAALVFVPVFKNLTHLPPFMGMMFSLAVIWITTELIHRKKTHEDRKRFSVAATLQKIDTASVLFFLGILLAVAALQEVGYLKSLAQILNDSLGDIYVINVAIGLLSSIIDNVPLVAAAQGMYDIAPAGDFAANGVFWQFLAYCAGTGGSCLLIGSAAGVAVMGLEKIDFIWYLKKISWLAILGYFAGVVTYILLHV
ncbi:MAG: sodium:proton antiporter NhaD [Flavobacteriales bacterium]